ncbi:MAG: benzoate-CoA ligase family protein [Planctomycetota bacterium]|nr:benzoate-CoA ligase family protein [Planctomycetota bacterium]
MFSDQFNLAHYLLEHNLEAGRGDKVALSWRDEEHRYSDLSDKSSRLAHGFLQLGLRPEERVLIVLPDRPEFAWTWFATLKCGAVFAMVNPLLKPEDYAYYLDYSQASIAVVDETLAETFHHLAEECPSLRAVVVAGGEGSSEESGKMQPSQHSCLGLISQAPDSPVMADTHRHDIAGWLFTSGSTGKPKAAVHSHENFAFNIEHYAKGVLEITENDITAGVPKLFFGYATGTNLMFPFAVGGSTVLFSDRSTPEKIYKVCEKYRPTILTSVPTMIGKMLACDSAQSPMDLPSLRLILSAGEKLPDALHRQWLERYNIEILDGIGSAELFHIYISNRPGAVRFGSLGQAVPGYDCRVVDNDGRQLPPGEVGRMEVRGESAALCYWQDPEKSETTFQGNLVITGDLFRVDEDGYFFYEGRADDLLKVGGVWVAPHEIEDCLLTHEAVEQAAVVGWEDEETLVKPKAFIVATDKDAPSTDKETEALKTTLQNWVKENLAPYKYPRFVEFVPDLPRNDRGKIDRKSLQQRQTSS